MAKKYILAIDPPILNSLEEVTEYIDLLQKRDPDLDLETLIIGSYIGEIQKNTNFVIKSGNKIKKLKCIEKTIETPEIKPEAEKEKYETENRKHSCSFCHRDYVRDAYVGGVVTYMCEQHLFVEKEAGDAYP
jgi:hypothetical protein